MYKKKNIIITGAQGQDGIILSKLLIKKKFNVIGIIKNKNLNKISKVKYHKVNLLNFKDLSKFLDTYKPYSLIHLGTENPNYLELKKNKDFYKKNLKATKNLIDYFSCNKIKKKLILIGSSQMYGISKNKVSLRSNFNPTNSYAKFRVEAYNYMMKVKKKYKSNMVTAIFFNHDSIHRKKKFLIPRLVKLIKKKNIIKINDIFQENISGDFSHADDFCEGLYKLMISKKNPNKLIFSSNKRIYMNDIIKFLLNLNGINKKFIIKKPKSLFTPIGDNNYTKKILNWKIKKNIFFAARELNKFYR